ncbi:hypothetical protein BC939DRAFT_527651 [Gamsiella multidivaricata]|uniref:uncharacterized protein n=1 Tax=Gamsiella multidivaricata TaxID=101098 RepID=UPI00221FF0B7|nr:uncharacterized protein BC939DRAFT_527651 [Gamsiella multidivaricata]KAI7826602.1 hypothetical protein BC939DRAFT_527651 [Gamsiella multidivaricata]
MQEKRRSTLRYESLSKARRLFYSLSRESSPSRHPRIKNLAPTSTIFETSIPRFRRCCKMGAKRKKENPTVSEKVMAVENTRKADMVRALRWKHPTATLDNGILSANVNRTLDREPDLAREVLKHIREAVHLSANTKRSRQKVVGRFIECDTTQGIFQE